MSIARRLAAALVLAVAIARPGPASAAGTDPDWPCIQVRNPQISAGAIWGGPELKPEANDWRSDEAVADAARTIASRRTSIEDAEKVIDKFAASVGADKEIRLERLFVGMLEIVNTERNRIIAGIVRYARKQRDFANRIEQDGDKIAKLKAGAVVEGATKDELAQIEEQMKWDTRIFEERNQSLSYVCEAPGLLEQRAFELARMIAEKL